VLAGGVSSTEAGAKAPRIRRGCGDNRGRSLSTMCAQGVCSDPRKVPSATFWQDPSLFNDNKNIYTIINFNENNNIYSTNNSILSTNNMNYYTNNIIYNTNHNNIFENNTINYKNKY
jgi:hypothetical protein